MNVAQRGNIIVPASSILEKKIHSLSDRLSLDLGTIVGQ